MRLNKAIQDVKFWNIKAGHIPEDDNDREELWRYNAELRALAYYLIEEEVWELGEAVLSTDEGGYRFPPGGLLPRKNDVEVLDAIVDILVTVFGLAAKAGLDELIEPAFKEVMRANWSKRNADGEFEFYPSGKIAKSDQYVAPDLRQFFDEEELIDEDE